MYVQGCNQVLKVGGPTEPMVENFRWQIEFRSKTKIQNRILVNILKYFTPLVKWVLDLGWLIWASTMYN